MSLSPSSGPHYITMSLEDFPNVTLPDVFLKETEHKCVETCAPPRHVCEFCGNSYKNASDATRHLRGKEHYNIRYLCPWPGCTGTPATEGSSLVYNLKTHFRLHTGEKPFACNICPYAAGDLAGLQRHRCPGRGGACPPLKRHAGKTKSTSTARAKAQPYANAQLKRTHKRRDTGEGLHLSIPPSSSTYLSPVSASTSGLSPLSSSNATLGPLSPSSSADFSPLYSTTSSADLSPLSSSSSNFGAFSPCSADASELSNTPALLYPGHGGACPPPKRRVRKTKSMAKAKAQPYATAQLKHTHKRRDTGEGLYLSIPPSSSSTYLSPLSASASGLSPLSSSSTALSPLSASSSAEFSPLCPTSSADLSPFYSSSSAGLSPLSSSSSHFGAFSPYSADINELSLSTPPAPLDPLSFPTELFPPTLDCSDQASLLFPELFGDSQALVGPDFPPMPHLAALPEWWMDGALFDAPAPAL